MLDIFSKNSVVVQQHAKSIHPEHLRIWRNCSHYRSSKPHFSNPCIEQPSFAEYPQCPACIWWTCSCCDRHGDLLHPSCYTRKQGILRAHCPYDNAHCRCISELSRSVEDSCVVGRTRSFDDSSGVCMGADLSITNTTSLDKSILRKRLNAGCPRTVQAPCLI